MSTVVMTKNTGASVSFPAREYLKTVGVVSARLDFSKATSVKGSMLTQGDIIQLINLPPNTLILGGAAQVLTVAGGGTSGAHVDIGTTGVSSKGLVDNGDVFTTIGVITPGTTGSWGWTVAVAAGGDTVDVALGTIVGTLAAGELRVDLVIAQIQTANTPPFSVG